MTWMNLSTAASKVISVLTQNSLYFTFDNMPVTIDSLTRRQKLNLVACGAHSLLRSGRTWALPPVVQIEPSSNCNLRCSLCPCGSKSMKRPSGQMSLATFDRVMSELGDAMVCAVLYAWGEPLLNSLLPQMIAACAKRNIATMTSTNGNALRDLDHALELVDSGLSHLVIAVDGAEQETYEAYRKGGELSTVFRCAELVTQAKAIRRSATPYTNIRTVLMSTNAGELDRIEAFARSVGANMFSWKSVGCLVDSPQYAGYVPIGPATGREPVAGGALTIQCPYPWRQPTIFWDVTVVACEFDYDAESPLGNVHKHSFKEIWSGDTIVGLRGMFRSNKARPSFCSRCPYPSRKSEGTVLGSKRLRPSA